MQLSGILDCALALSLVLVCIAGVSAKNVNWIELMEREAEENMHPSLPTRENRYSSRYSDEELGSDFWNANAQNTLKAHLDQQPITTKAKNVILFIGDGMSIPTLAAARIYMGQLEGLDGEEEQLSFEKFPYTGLSKTYCVDSQVPDSACTATAYLTGVKNNQATIGVTASVIENNCTAELDPANRLTSIAQWAQTANKRTGIVTTTRVTHASPAGAYAKTSNRDWESDSNVVGSGQDPAVCIDIAKQLITENPGTNFNVILGGGRSEFRPATVLDEEGQRGYRLDREDLIERWQTEKADAGLLARYEWNRDGLLSVNADETDYLLGLFEGSHCRYNLDRDQVLDPTLAEMTQKAIEILSKGTEGFFLFVEGGRIDHAHHDTTAQKALDETVELSKAVEVARSMTNLEDTLIVVTSDHAHTLSVNGYPVRGSPIFAATSTSNVDGLPYATLSYANGPGYKEGNAGGRYDLSQDDLTDKNYKFPTMVPLSSETHGGDDVGVFASGPWAHLFTGMYEQNIIPHVLAYATCVGEGQQFCDSRR